MALLIAKKAIGEFSEKLSARGIELNVTEACYKFIAEKGYSSVYGAREILRFVQSSIKPHFVDAVLFGDLVNGGVTVVDVKNGKIIFKDNKK